MGARIGEKLPAKPVVFGNPKKLAKEDKLLREALEEEEKHQAPADRSLMLALRYKRYKEARRAIERKGDVNFIQNTASDRTLLHQAVIADDVIAAELLCLKGADLFALDSKWMNPTKLSMMRGLPDMFKLLISWGGEIRPSNPSNSSLRFLFNINP
ncbi:hypothetical protein T484DRAFT_2950888 [Baffinella frigidus]|nr:hypothetical protein T484DRAFT_2950888 [Cryptophyta sp. CCMP2293]